MSQDLNDLLSGWPYQPGKLQVRKITGSDGRTKIQLRLDMGLLQLEAAGRPDGLRPFDSESLYDYSRERAAEAEAAGAEFKLTPEEVGELQSEGIQYYHRYVALYQLEDWKGVARDTRRNLDMFSFVAKYTPNEEMAWTVQQFRPYVLMMNTRAKAYQAIEKNDMAAAIELVEKGIASIERFLRDNQHPEVAGESTELATLSEWLAELRKKSKAASRPKPPRPPKPVSPLDQMRREMAKAVRAEQYERAAELRDAIRALETQQQGAR
jgi:UvrB/uvrC motif